MLFVLCHLSGSLRLATTPVASAELGKTFELKVCQRDAKMNICTRLSIKHDNVRSTFRVSIPVAWLTAMVNS